ncbi:RNA recognition domain-containing protein [Diplocarpon rosae]|nr:RNA recognition domain-containing protein [Diplocarpon rosae]
MLFSEEDAPLLKKWIVKRLENTSDADADVLADYVLALLRHDGDTETVRQLCEAEIPDFLKEDSTIFVQDVFDAIQYKSYLPGAPPIRKRSVPFAPPSGPSALSAHSYGNLGMGVPNGPQNGSRKRSFNERGGGDLQDRGYMPGDSNGRAFKQVRRGGQVRGGFEGFNPNGGRGGFAGGRPPPMNLQGMPSNGFSSMPGMPSPPPGMPPMDPNNPMAAILAMHAMGFPVPGMSDVSQVTSPGLPLPSQKPRCRDFDQKGFCARGNQCHFEHGEHKIWVPPPAHGGDEYDPSNSGLMTGIEGTSPGPGPGPNPFNQFRGVDRGRGRGTFGRGDRMQLSGPGRRSGRSEFSSDRPNYDKSNTSIVVENIPEDRFSEDEVRGFFSEFGSIRDVSMRPYKRLAIIKYDNWNAANEAYKSPAVIFDNRFVKVYWFNGDESLPKPLTATKPNGGFKRERSDASAPAPARQTSEPQVDIEEFARKQAELQKAHEEKIKKKQEMEAAKKELEKRQEELLKNQAEEKRKLMERIAAKSGKPGTSANGSLNGTPALETKSVSQTDALKAQLAALEAEAKSLGLDTSLTDTNSFGGRGRGRGRARGGYRGRGDFVPRGRGTYRGRGGVPFSADGRSFNLDNRPKTVSVTGVDFTDGAKDAALREYLFPIGEFTNLDTTSARTHITFKDRHTAEQFLASVSRDSGEIPSAGKVELAWIKTPLQPVVLQAAKPAIIKPEDTQMDEGDAMAASSPTRVTAAHAEGSHEEQHNLDYDVADDNDWGVQ